MLPHDWERRKPPGTRRVAAGHLVVVDRLEATGSPTHFGTVFRLNDDLLGRVRARMAGMRAMTGTPA